MDAAAKHKDENKDGNATEHTGASVNLLWLIDAGRIPEVEFVSRPDDRALQKCVADTQGPVRGDGPGPQPCLVSAATVRGFLF